MAAGYSRHTPVGEMESHVKLYIRRLRDAAPHFAGGYCNLRRSLMTTEEWLASDITVDKSRKGYAHFDRRTDIKEQRRYI